MEKEVTPAKAPIANTPKPTDTPKLSPTPTKETSPIPSPPVQKPKPVNYKYAGKESLAQIIGKSIPKQFIPTKRIGSIFGLIFLLVIIIAAFQFPFGSLMSGNIDLTIKMGYPLPFLELELKETDTSPLKPINLILDILLYIILAYAIDVALNLILKNPLLKSKEETKKIPIVFKNKKPRILEKLTEKVAEKTGTK